jgi:hypothetical protein
MEGLSHKTRKRLRKLSKKTKKKRHKRHKRHKHRTNELDGYQASTDFSNMPVGAVFPSIGMGAVSVGGIMRHS